jgi:hypothetical protein
MPRPYGIYRRLQGNGFPERFQILSLSGNDCKGTGERCTLAHIDRKKRCYACNEIKLLENAAARAMWRITKCRRVT